MEEYNLKEKVNLICVEAKSFPDGIEAAFDNLQSALPHCEKRTWYGISRPENGIIIYKAAVTELIEGEADATNFEPFTITEGTYLTVTLTDWMTDSQVIGTTFSKLLKDPRLDQNFPCIEWYKNQKDVICMIRIENN